MSSPKQNEFQFTSRLAYTIKNYWQKRGFNPEITVAKKIINEAERTSNDHEVSYFAIHSDIAATLAKKFDS